jgi:hypothetical protein
MNEVQEYVEKRAVGNSAPVFQNLDKQMSSITQLGDALYKSGFAGCQKVEQGVIIAFTCLAEKITPIEFARSYDIIQGQPTKKAAVMLAELRSKHQGDFEWTADGEDGKKATIVITYKGKKKSPVSFTIEEAKSKGLASKPNWKMHLPEMLRARASTKALRMHVPEIAAGIYDPNEIEDSIDISVSPEMPIVQDDFTPQDLKTALDSISPELSDKATELILTRFKVKSLNKLTSAQSTRVMAKFDSFIEGISSDGSSQT